MADQTLEQLELEKIKAEIALLRAEEEKLKKNHFFDRIKYIITIVGAAILFFLITRPDSILSRKASKEDLSRERAKLVIDVLSNESPNKALLSLQLIKSSFPEEKNSWIDSAQQYIEDYFVYKFIDEINIEIDSIASEKGLLFESFKSSFQDIEDQQNRLRVRIKSVEKNPNFLEYVSNVQSDGLVKKVKVLNDNGKKQIALLKTEIESLYNKLIPYKEKNLQLNVKLEFLRKEIDNFNKSYEIPKSLYQRIETLLNQFNIDF